SLRRYGINPTVTILPNAVTRVTASYERFHDGRTADRGIPSFLGRPAAVAIETFFGNPKLSHAQTNVDLISLNLERQFGRFRLHNRMMAGNYDKFYQNFVPGSVNSARTLVAISSYNNSTRRRNLFNQTDGTIALSTGSIRHTFVLGTEFGR